MISADHLELVQVRAVGGQVVDVATVLVGDVVAAPAVVLLHDRAHRFGEIHHDVGAALVGESQVEIASADDLAEKVDREARLRRVQEIEVAEEGDLDPALALLAAQIDAERVDDGGEPGRHDEGRALDERLRFLRNLHQPRRRAIRRERGAARLGDPVDRLQHARVDQRIGQHHDVIAGLDRHHLVEVVGALHVAAHVDLRIVHRVRQATPRLRLENVRNRGRNQGHGVLHESRAINLGLLAAFDRAAVAPSLGHFAKAGR
jgi:hypothetical protein